MVFETVQTTLAAYKEIDPATITLNTTFAQLELDSLDTVELVMQLEEALDIQLEVGEPLTSVKELVELIQAKQN